MVGGAAGDSRPATVWTLGEPDPANAERIRRELALHPAVARLLVQRGISEPDDARRFLHPSLADLHDPSLLADLERAVDRLLHALANRERIVVHGDYDVDGVSATVMLRRALALLGGDVDHYIPERLTDGYGLLPQTVERLHARGVRVLVSVDCGIRSSEAAARARSLGIDLIITDHHEPGSALPAALAVVNPRRADCPYPDKDLAGAGVAFKLVQALCRRSGRPEWLPAFAKLAAIGTLADAVPLRGENRVIARVGLDRLTAGPNAVGLQALLDASGLTGRRVESEDVAFRVAPRINAAGRMRSADLAARLLLATGRQQAAVARQLAEDLDTENGRRRAEEAVIAAAAQRAVGEDPQADDARLLVVWGEGWHRGVIGIVASKLVETFARPAIVLSVDGKTARGSGRSIPGFDLLAALEQCADLCSRFGGHRQAAGLELPADRLPELRRRLRAYARARIGPADLVHRLAIDDTLALTDIRPPLVEGLRALEPFGSGNPRPVFRAARVEVVDGPRTMKEQHLRMTVRQGGARFRAVAWRAADRVAFYEAHRAGLQLAFSVVENTYQGHTSTELTVADAAQPAARPQAAGSSVVRPARRRPE